jgi:hypothetical protein
MRTLFSIILIVVSLFAGFYFAKMLYHKSDDTSSLMIQNYSFVKEIAELGSLEVNGTTQIKSTNVDANDNGWTADLKKIFLEKSYIMSVPYTAKFGVNLGDSTMKINNQDSLIQILLPEAKLLSFELRMDKMVAMDKKGIFRTESEDKITELQKKLYLEAKTQLDTNTAYKKQAQEKVCHILTQYFAATHKQVECRFGSSIITNKK